MNHTGARHEGDLRGNPVSSPVPSQLAGDHNQLDVKGPQADRRGCGDLAGDPKPRQWNPFRKIPLLITIIFWAIACILYLLLLQDLHAMQVEPDPGFDPYAILGGQSLMLLVTLAAWLACLFTLSSQEGRILRLITCVLCILATTSNAFLTYGLAILVIWEGWTLCKSYLVIALICFVGNTLFLSAMLIKWYRRVP